MIPSSHLSYRTIQEPLVEHSLTQQDQAQPSHPYSNNQGQVCENTENQDWDGGINVTDKIDLECLNENIPSTSTRSNTPAKRETLDKLKRNIILKEKELGKHKRIELCKTLSYRDVLASKLSYPVPLEV